MFYVLWKNRDSAEWFSEGMFPSLNHAQDYVADEALFSEATDVVFIQRHMDNTISVIQDDEIEDENEGDE
jgi:hypothetical protein